MNQGVFLLPKCMSSVLHLVLKLCKALCRCLWYILLEYAVMNHVLVIPAINSDPCKCTHFLGFTSSSWSTVAPADKRVFTILTLPERLASHSGVEPSYRWNSTMSGASRMDSYVMYVHTFLARSRFALASSSLTVISKYLFWQATRRAVVPS